MSAQSILSTESLNKEMKKPKKRLADILDHLQRVASNNSPRGRRRRCFIASSLSPRSIHPKKVSLDGVKSKSFTLEMTKDEETTFFKTLLKSVPSDQPPSLEDSSTVSTHSHTEGSKAVLKPNDLPMNREKTTENKIAEPKPGVTLRDTAVQANFETSRYASIEHKFQSKNDKNTRVCEKSKGKKSSRDEVETIFISRDDHNSDANIEISHTEQVTGKGDKERDTKYQQEVSSTSAGNSKHLKQKNVYKPKSKTISRKSAFGTLYKNNQSSKLNTNLKLATQFCEHCHKTQINDKKKQETSSNEEPFNVEKNENEQVTAKSKQYMKKSVGNKDRNMQLKSNIENLEIRANMKQKEYHHLDEKENSKPKGRKFQSTSTQLNPETFHSCGRKTSNIRRQASKTRHVVESSSEAGSRFPPPDGGDCGSKRSRKKFERSQQDPEELEVLTCSCTESNDASPCGVALTPDLFCSMCHVQANSKKQMELHLRGARHFLTLKKCLDVSHSQVHAHFTEERDERDPDLTTRVMGLLNKRGEEVRLTLNLLVPPNIFNKYIGQDAL